VAGNRLERGPLAIITWTLISLLAAAGVTVDLGGLKSAAPASWKESPVSNPMRVKQFTVPGKENPDAELAIFYFGQGQGGSTEANLDRWKKQFVAADGKSEAPSKTSAVKVASGTSATVLDIQGTWLYKASPMAPGAPEPRPNHRMLAAVLESPKGNYYVRLVGPAKTIEQNKKEFDGWLKAFK
jgi:hypothetical protein